MDSEVLKCSVMCGTAGVYMSSERGVTSDPMTSSAMRPSGPSLRCGRTSQVCSDIPVNLLANASLYYTRFAFARGNVAVKVVPCASSLATVRVPPCSSAMACAMASPRP